MNGQPIGGVVIVSADGRDVCQGCGRPVTDYLGVLNITHMMPCPEVDKLIRARNAT